MYKFTRYGHPTAIIWHAAGMTHTKHDLQTTNTITWHTSGDPHKAWPPNCKHITWHTPGMTHELNSNNITLMYWWQSMHKAWSYNFTWNIHTVQKVLTNLLTASMHILLPVGDGILGVHVTSLLLVTASPP